ncbi:MAG TPA: hypothetical protein VFY79_11650, partial [Dehalococcoidia bacterium]|nr:hypothetical protein [Dehalococcoidia bacterium]
MSVFGGLERDLAEAASRGFVSQRRYAGQLRYRRKRLLSALSGLLLIAFGSGCLRSGVTHQHFVNNYKTVAASASADHYTPYWLGYGFSAAGVQFKGPGTGDFAYVVPGGGVIAEYAPESGAGLLTLTCYSPKAWAMWQAQNPHANDAASELSV